jgi:arylsulfatase A-like enzyme
MSKRPNILFIWTDEQRADTMACYGNSFVQAPHLNELASESCVFENAYCTQPICTPSRASILTGRYPHSHGCIRNNMPLPRDLPTLAERTNGAYHCSYFGKWHLGDEIIPQRGFTDWVSIEDGIYRPFYSKPEYLKQFSSYHQFLVQNGFPPNAKATDGARVFARNQTAVMAERFTKAGFLGDSAAKFLEDYRGDKPFFLSVNFLEPHMPFFGPFNDLHDPDKIPVGRAFCKKPPANASLRHRYFAAKYEAFGYSHEDHDPFPLKTDQDWRRLRSNYLGLVSLVDRSVGKILQALKKSGHDEDTVVVYTSDHGDMMGDHGIVSKMVMYEEAIKIPLLVRVPHLKSKCRTIPGRVSQIDLVPTLLDLMDLPKDAQLQGTSLVDVLEGGRDLKNNDVMVEWNPEFENPKASGNKPAPGFTEDDVERAMKQHCRTLVSHEGWKLSLSDNDVAELYDLNSDPHELNNLFGEEKYRSMAKRLSSRIHDWQQRTNDRVSLSVESM